MNTLIKPLPVTFLGCLKSRAALHLEVLALRQQLAMIAERDRKRLRIHPQERWFWILLYRLWPSCLQTLMVFQPDTLVRWHRKGFSFYWRLKSRGGRDGRPAISREIRQLIRTMSRDNVGWGAPRIHGELRMLGIDVSESTWRSI
jgi:putative transposase